MKKLFKIIIFFSLLLTLCACGNKQEEKVYVSADELNGQPMGCMSGSIFDELIKEKFPESEISYFGSRSELMLALTSGKIEGFISDEPVAMMMKSANKEVNYLNEAVGNVEYGICFSDDAKDKLLQFNDYLTSINTNGHLKELQEKWINPDGGNKNKEEINLSGENGILKCVTTPDAAPFSFIVQNEFEGFEVELLTEFCKEYGYGLDISTVSFDALLTSVKTGKYDIAFNGIYITPERAKSVNFSMPTYEGRDVVMVRSGIASADKNIFESIKDSFYRNFIEEDRYKLLIEGALVTLEISIFSILGGSLFGMLIYVLSSISSVFKKIADMIQKVLSKLPAVVILMILFYVIFRSSKIDATLVSIIGFAFIFGNTVYGLIKTGVASVDNGQNEAALALGYGNWLSFFHIILPQALKTVYNSLITEMTSLIKNTSIVGYVSVNDITRSSDIIRGRTYDALFPLIVVAIIYYFLCTLLVAVFRIPLLKYINKKVKYND